MPLRSEKFPIDLQWGNGVFMLAHSFLIESSSKLLVTRTGIKSRTSSILGLWFPWLICMSFRMRFDLGTLDSSERSLPFGLLVLTKHVKYTYSYLFKCVLYSIVASKAN